MRVALVTAGTRGDAQPLALLALELQARGHDVVVGVSPNLVEWVQRAGVRALPFGPDTLAFMRSPQGQEWLAAGDVRRFMARLSEVSQAHWDATMAETEALVAGADLVVSGILAEDAALPAARAVGARVALLHSFPVRRTRGYPAALVTARQLPGPLNLLTHRLFERVWWQGMKQDMARFEERLGLPHDRRSTAQQAEQDGLLEVQAYSPALVGRTGWGPRRPLVGFLRPTPQLRERLGEGSVPEDVEAFLAAGERPVFVGFGSMPVRDPAAALAAVRSACHELGVRALVSAGWAGLGGIAADGDERLLVTGDLDHARVLPRCRAAVHHGGAGTTAAALEAGVPALVASVFADQPFWGARLEEHGAGRALRFADLDAARLVAGLRDVLDEPRAAAAAALGARLRAEDDAVVRAADLVEQEGAGRAPAAA